MMSLGRKALAEKILVLGVDGMDPKLTRKYIKEGLMPNTQKFIERGAARQDLVMLGAQPTVTPPMWTTMATGAYPMTHGITCFFRHSAAENLDTIEYNLDSTNCRAEQLWNVFAEAGKKTLVWHWPGSSWPPTSDSSNLSVVDGTQPAFPNCGVAFVEDNIILVASEKIDDLLFRSKVASDGKVPCMINDLETASEGNTNLKDAIYAKKTVSIMLTHADGEGSLSDKPWDIVMSPIKTAQGWAAAPADAREFTILFSAGLVRRPALILKNDAGIYDQVAIYRSKKDLSPLAVIQKDVFYKDYIDEFYKNDVKHTGNRNMRILEIAPDGSTVKMWFSPVFNITVDTMFHPKSLYKKIVENVGYIPPVCVMGGNNPQITEECMLASWTHNADWQARVLNYLIEEEHYEIIFSHLHNIDAQGHMIVKFLKNGNKNLPGEFFQEALKQTYLQTDAYLGQFLHLLDEGWSIFIVSDHAQICPEYGAPLIGDMGGVNVTVMRELGFTNVKKDADGNDLKEIDWSTTRAVAQRGNHIYLNLKGRDPQGIVDPADQYEVEEEIMTALYGYRDPHTGKRIISLALRNKDAVLLGLGGPESGDILYWNAEGYNYDHCDSLSTLEGFADTSVSPIVIFAGQGIKEGFTTDRVIRQVDLAPTLAVIGGVRMPRQCEGAPVYQILTEEF